MYDVSYRNFACESIHSGTLHWEQFRQQLLYDKTRIEERAIHYGFTTNDLYNMDLATMSQKLPEEIPLSKRRALATSLLSFPSVEQYYLLFTQAREDRWRISNIGPHIQTTRCADSTFSESSYADMADALRLGKTPLFFLSSTLHAPMMLEAIRHGKSIAIHVESENFAENLSGKGRQQLAQSEMVHRLALKPSLPSKMMRQIFMSYVTEATSSYADTIAYHPTVSKLNAITQSCFVAMKRHGQMRYLDAALCLTRQNMFRIPELLQRIGVKFKKHHVGSDKFCIVPNIDSEELNYTLSQALSAPMTYSASTKRSKSPLSLGL